MQMWSMQEYKLVVPAKALLHAHIFCPAVCIDEKSESFQRSVSNLHQSVCKTGGHLSPCI